MGLRSVLIFFILLVRGRFYTSQSDVYRRQIVPYKDGPRAERVKLRLQHSIRIVRTLTG